MYHKIKNQSLFAFLFCNTFHFSFDSDAVGNCLGFVSLET